MYKAVITLAFGNTGACETRQFWSGTGTHQSRSPRKAMRMAQVKAERACGEGACWVPIIRQVQLVKDGAVILQEWS